MSHNSAAALIDNTAGFGSCETCDDTGLATSRERVYDGHSYPHWAEPCTLCELGQAQRRRIASLRVSWRYAETESEAA